MFPPRHTAARHLDTTASVGRKEGLARMSCNGAPTRCKSSRSAHRRWGCANNANHFAHPQAFNCTSHAAASTHFLPDEKRPVHMDPSFLENTTRSGLNGTHTPDTVCESETKKPGMEPWLDRPSSDRLGELNPCGSCSNAILHRFRVFWQSVALESTYDYETYEWKDWPRCRHWAIHPSSRGIATAQYHGD